MNMGVYEQGIIPLVLIIQIGIYWPDFICILSRIWNWSLYNKMTLSKIEFSDLIRCYHPHGISEVLLLLHRFYSAEII